MSFSYRFIGFLLLVSAFLLFLIQPLVSKLLLPVMGGTPSVWTTSMLFFQALLLGGYCWAHIMIRYMPLYAPPLLQLLMTAAGLYLINFSIDLHPDFTSRSPVFWQLTTMFQIIGLPYFVLATNAPLYQALYKNFIDQTQSKKTPYALYSLSNNGSFLALVAYPFALEPLLTLENQSSFWSYGYAFLCLLVACSALVFMRMYMTNREALQTRHKIEKTRDEASPYTLKNISLWLLLAFIPSSLMMGVTSHITTDIASVPLLWVVPLAFYLASFIIAFAEPPLWWAKNDSTAYFAAFISAAIVLFSTAFPTLMANISKLFIHYIAFLFIATYAHLLLARVKPDAKYLTGFFIFVSLGGVMGGIFNALLAYQIFDTAKEYPIGIALFLIVIFLSKTDGWRRMNSDNFAAFAVVFSLIFLLALALKYAFLQFFAFLAGILILTAFYNVRKVAFAVMVCLIVATFIQDFHRDYVLQERNIFGVLKIADNTKTSIRTFQHGTTLHGLQKLPLSDSPTPTSYFHPEGPLGDVFRYLDSKSDNVPQSIAILGMGTGATACYTKPNRDFTFVEIDKSVIDIASNPDYFTYLSACQPEARILLGDGRIELEKQENNNYDLIILDAFSSDSVPVHFLTTEAFEMYKQKIKPGGIIVYNISNRYFDFRHLVANLAAAHGFEAGYKESKTKPDDPTFHPSSYMIVTQSEDTIKAISNQSDDPWVTEGLARPSQRLWTDSYANIFQVMKF